MKTSKKNFRKVVITLIIFLALSFSLYYFKNSKPIIFVQGIPQQIFSYPKSFVFSFSKNNDSRQVTKLKEENYKLTQQIVDISLLKNENNALKSQFDTVGINTQKLTAAKIVGFLGEQNEPTAFVINVGEKDEITKGQSVIFQRNLVGVISQVSQNFSVVTTPFSQKFQALAKVPETSANGILIGSGDFFLLQRVVITDNVKNNDFVVTKGQVGTNGIGIMPDLTIGKITSVAKNETSPFQSAKVMPIIDFSNLDYVFVIKSL